MNVWIVTAREYEDSWLIKGFLNERDAINHADLLTYERDHTKSGRKAYHRREFNGPPWYSVETLEVEDGSTNLDNK